MTTLERDAREFLTAWAPDSFKVSQKDGMVVLHIKHLEHNVVLRMTPDIAMALAVLIAEKAGENI